MAAKLQWKGSDQSRKGSEKAAKRQWNGRVAPCLLELRSVETLVDPPSATAVPPTA